MAKILIIDDDEQVLKVLISYLEKGGHEISSATDGKQGIKMIASQRFDLVITDIIMPEQDGLEVLLWLKDQVDKPKIIAISGGSPSMDQNFLLKLSQRFSADKVLPKPISFETLNKTIAELMQECQTRVQ